MGHGLRHQRDIASAGRGDGGMTRAAITPVTNGGTYRFGACGLQHNKPTLGVVCQTVNR